MDDKEHYARGMAVRRKVAGNAWVDRAIANTTPFNAEFQDLITRYAWGQIWTRPHFDERTRPLHPTGDRETHWDEAAIADEFEWKDPSGTGGEP